MNPSPRCTRTKAKTPMIESNAANQCQRPRIVFTAAFTSLLLLSACKRTEEKDVVLETIQARDFIVEMPAAGILKAVKSTPLPVPGNQFAGRQLQWHVPDGSLVKAGELIARFTADRSQLERDQARIDLLRNALLQQAKERELTQTVGRVDVDLAQVETDLSIAETYADAELAALARNQVLDAIQDRAFLGEKKTVLSWQRGQSSARSQAEMAVLNSQHSSANARFQKSDNDLKALELRAPHDGVFVLVADWSGDKPQIGGNMYAGQEFARFPDPNEYEVELSLPVLEAMQVKVGQLVQLSPTGRPEQKVESKIEWIATTPQQQGRQNPIKMLKLKTKVPRTVVTESWVPGQSISTTIQLVRANKTISVANLALVSKPEGDHVYVARKGKFELRKVQLGDRGAARSVVKSGLKAGESICVIASECGA